MEDILKKLNIDETLTKRKKKAKVFTRVKDQIGSEEKHYNYMADLLILPETTKGNKYLLVVVDLASDNFDIEPMKNKDANTTLEALLKIFKRKFIKKPERSIQTDGGKEFQKEFHKFLYNNNIYHGVTKPGRHSQNSNVERLNRTLGRLFNGYMNAKEKKTGKQYNDWDDIINFIRTELNELRANRLKKIEKKEIENEFKDKEKPKKTPKNKYNEGDVVRYYLDVPMNALNNKQDTVTFREGDYKWSPTTHKIKTVVYDGPPIYWRYILEGMPKISYTENQLMKVDDKDTTYQIKAIRDMRTKNKKKEYLIHWKGYKVSESTWEPENELLKDISKAELKQLVKQYKDKIKK